jgi:vesicle-associated membrane protein 7
LFCCFLFLSLLDKKNFNIDYKRKGKKEKTPTGKKIGKKKNNKKTKQKMSTAIVGSSGIVYALVSKGDSVLAEFTTANGNFIMVSRIILQKIPPDHEGKKMSFAYDTHMFHYLVEDGVTYLCMSDDKFPRRVAFTFLQDIQSCFTSAYSPGEVDAAVAFAFNDVFSRTLAEKMHYYNTDPTADKLTAARSQVESTKATMIENIDKILGRGERIELLVARTETLNEHSFKFKEQSKKLKCAVLVRSIRFWIIISVIALFLLWLVLSLACGFDFSGC